MKKLIPGAAAALLLGTLGFAVGAPTLAAADVTCNGTISNRRVNDNVEVRNGATCNIINSVIDGDVKIAPNARLYVSGSRIDGNIQDTNQNHYSVVVVNSRIGGNIQLEGGQYTKITGNTVDGDVQLWSNRQIQRVFRNVIDGNLQCKSNVPQPTGLYNTVRGNAEDQCRNLKQVSVLTKNQGSRLSAVNGRVSVSGTLRVYNTYGDLQPLAGQRIHVQTSPAGANQYTTRATVTTAANGTWSASIPRQAGWYVRAVFTGWSTGTPSYTWVGQMA